ncbi:hypothetical protein F383_08293 [Gossypium arboreum]|uniref:Uncharacterized protein n=1 Tax=Gossypium arboreum TaxID=29729 RepID=A0A0B0PT22_GOSAR|nr:hypothetical protein F383_08293 [Gossypium arboreum]
MSSTTWNDRPRFFPYSYIFFVTLQWNIEKARANSSKPRIPLCFVSNKSNICSEIRNILTTTQAILW